jgi:hypothetical protein
MIKTVAKVTQEKADEIRGQAIAHTHFNPVQDANGNWVISLATAQYLDSSDYEIINWEAPETEEL